MHFVETMSLFSGLKSKRPFIDESFFPVSAKKYITICTENHQSKQWDSFQEYIDIISPILKKNNISIIEIGENDINFKNITVLKRATNENHWAFIIKNSLVHIGPENFISSLAALKNTPCITLFSNTSPEYAAPNWIECDATQDFVVPMEGRYKPSFASQEQNKTINKISAESIVAKTLDLLNINNSFNKYDVFSTGNLYYNKVIEVIPDFSPAPDFFPNSLLNIRLDYHFNTQSLKLFANQRKLAIVSDKEIPENILFDIKPSLQMLYFKIDEFSNPDYFLTLKQKGFNLELIFKKDADLSKTRFIFFDWLVNEEDRHDKNNLDNSEKICDTTRYKSSKSIFSKEGVFSCKCAFDKKVTEHQDQMIFHEKSFWDESSYFKFYNLK